jgi:hypothetical protein
MVKSTERAPGIYRATFTALDLDYRITDKETGEEVRRWRWVFQETKDPTTVGEIDTISSPSLAKGTNGLKFFTGMLGRPPVPDVDDTDELVGQTFDVTYGPNQNGRLTIIGVTRVGLDNQPVPKADVPMTTLPNQVPGELP